MGQDVVFNFLRDNKDLWFSVGEIHEGLGGVVSLNSVNMSVKRMRSNPVIVRAKKEFRRMSNGYRKVWVYKFKKVN